MWLLLLPEAKVWQRTHLDAGSKLFTTSSSPKAQSATQGYVLLHSLTCCDCATLLTAFL